MNTSATPLLERSILDCDPFGIIPIEPSSPEFYCALFGHDDTKSVASVTSAVASCCSPFYPAESTTGNGCNIHYCGLPPYEAIDTETTTSTVLFNPAQSGLPYVTSVATATYTYDAIVGYPVVSSCLARVAVGQYGIACRVAGSRRAVTMTGPESIPRTDVVTATSSAQRTVSASSTSTRSTGAARSDAVRTVKSSWLYFLVASSLFMAR